MKIDKKKRLGKKSTKGTGANKVDKNPKEDKVEVKEAKGQKLYLVDVAYGSLEVQVKEIEITKETEKMYKISGCNRVNLNKCDLDTLLGWNRTSVFTFDPKAGKAMVLKRCEEELKKHQDLVKKYTKAVKDLK